MFSLKSLKNISLVSALLITLAACTSPKQAKIDFDKETNFKQYQTFAFYQTVKAEPAETAEATAAPSYDPLVDQHIKAAISREMTALGYRYAPESAELLVNYSTNTETREDIRTSPFRIKASYGFFGRNSAFHLGMPLYGEVETHRYQVGSLLIDVVDAAANRLIWQGMLEGKLSKKALQQPEQAINEAVGIIYQSYPTRLASTAAK